MPVALQPLKVGSYVGGALVAEIAVLLQSLVDDALQLCWKVRVQADRRSRNLVQNRVENCRRSATFEGKAPGAHLVQYDSERKNVGARIQFLGQGLLGAHVSHGADGRAGRGQMFDPHSGGSGRDFCRFQGFAVVNAHFG